MSLCFCFGCRPRFLDSTSSAGQTLLVASAVGAGVLHPIAADQPLRGFSTLLDEIRHGLSMPVRLTHGCLGSSSCDAHWLGRPASADGGWPDPPGSGPPLAGTGPAPVTSSLLRQLQLQQLRSVVRHFDNQIADSQLSATADYTYTCRCTHGYGLGRYLAARRLSQHCERSRWRAICGRRATSSQSRACSLCVSLSWAACGSSCLAVCSQRRFCVLQGTMLAYYTSKDEYLGKLVPPRKVLEIVGLQAEAAAGAFADKHLHAAFAIDYLGGTTYQCHADSRAEKDKWIGAIEHALEEPDRILIEEVEEAHHEVQEQVTKEQQAVQQATLAVQEAQMCNQQTNACNQQIAECKREAEGLTGQLKHTRLAYEEASHRVQDTKKMLDAARQKAHDAMADHDADRPEIHDAAHDEIAQRIERLAAQLEVDTTHEDTYRKNTETVEATISVLMKKIEQLEQQAKELTEEGPALRARASASLQQAHSVKQITRMRVATWSASPSHLSPLAEGYLLCKHPKKPSMHRKYYVLVGSTLCWYKCADSFMTRMAEPLGVAHVTGVDNWNGIVGKGRKKPYEHAFAISSVEGPTLYCSAPMRQSAEVWNLGLHICLTMPPLAPHRALAARARRDSLDLTSAVLPATLAARRASMHNFSGGQSADDPSQSSEDPAGAGSDAVLIEGYLTKKSAIVPVMKKKFCVLKGLRLHVFDSHDAYEEQDADHEEILVCSVSDWDGHGVLLHYHHGFQIHTLKHQAIYCSATSKHEKEKWVHGIHEALLKHRDELVAPTRHQEDMLKQAQDEVTQLMGTADRRNTSMNGTAPQKVLEARLLEYYKEHNAAKMDDVKMLMERYKNRETALIRHLDRIYGTQLMEENGMKDLLEKVAASFSDVSKRRSSGISSGLRDFVKMVGYLSWNGTTEKSFCVLSVNKLLRYNTLGHYETEPYNPIQSVLLYSVHESPDHGPTTAFSVAYMPSDSAETSHKNEKQPEHRRRSELILATSTREEKVRWMAKIRSGLGFVHAHDASSVTAVAKQAAHGSHAQAIEPLRRKLVEYYAQQNPSKVGEVDTLLSYFNGREMRLLEDLDSTFGTRIADDPVYVSLLSAISIPLQGDIPALALRHESYLWVKHPTLGASFRKCYCVLLNEVWSCYNSRLHAHQAEDGAAEESEEDSRASTEPLLLDEVVNMTFLNAKLKEMHVLSIETQSNGVVLLRGDVESAVDEWTHALRQVVDVRLKRQEQESTATIAVPEGPLGEIYELLVAFYRTHNADKVSEVRTLLHAYEGRESLLIEQLDGIYFSKLATDARIVELLKALGDSRKDELSDLGASTSDESQDQFLMEGYMSTRAGASGAVRKQYCILIKQEFKCYSTHDDSQNTSITPQSSFFVEIVSDWDGKTNTQKYDHGMELETKDGKTFFCAAFTSEDKAKWMTAFHHAIAMGRLDSTNPRRSPTKPGSDRRLIREKQWKDRLVAFYQEKNPSKVSDLDALLSFYSGRELPLLEAIDVAYGSKLAQDPALLAMIPKADDIHSKVLAALQYEGSVQRSTNPGYAQAHNVHMTMNGLDVKFYASRDESTRGNQSIASVSVLALREISAERFAIETFEHEWIYLQAPNANEKNEWVQILEAAVDAMMAQHLLEEEVQELQSKRPSRKRQNSVLMQEFLLLLLDFEEVTAKLRSKESKPVVMGERFVALNSSMDLVIYNDTHEKIIAQFTVLSTRAWSVPPEQKQDCRFPFQIVTQEQVMLSCSAGSELERARWIKQIRLGGEQMVALELLEEQRQEAECEAKKHHTEQTRTEHSEIIIPAFGTSHDQATEVTKGYLDFTIGTSGLLNPSKEAYVVLSATAMMTLYASEAAFFDAQEPLFCGQITEIVDLFPTSSPTKRQLLKLFNDMDAFAFAVHTKSERQQATVHLFPTSQSERVFWVRAITSGLDVIQGEALLAGEKLVLSLEKAEMDNPEQPSEVDEEKSTFVFPAASMEGQLTQWHEKRVFMAHSITSDLAPLYVVLVGSNIRCYTSREGILSNSDGFTRLEAEIESISDWQPPHKAHTQGAPVDTGNESLGFQIEVMQTSSSSHKEATTLFFTASSLRAKQRWVHVIKQEIDFALAEKYLDEEGEEVARLAAASTTGSGTTDATGCTTHMAGYMHVRHHSLGAMWHERYVVLDGPAMFVYEENSDASEDSTRRKAMEKHDVLGIEKWHPTYSSQAHKGGRSQHAKHHRFGFRVENEAGGFLECTVVLEREQTQWMEAITAAINDLSSSFLSGKVMTRDAALPFVAGATMEGYLKVRESKHALAARWKRNYCVLMGTQCLLYDSQEHAVELGTEHEPHSGVAPLGVYDLMAAKAWDHEDHATSLLGMLEDDADLSSHAFRVEYMAAEDLWLDCKAHSGLERKRWLDAIEDEIRKGEQENQRSTSAEQQQRDKKARQSAIKSRFQAAQEDAFRQSAMLKDALQINFPDESDDSEDDSDDEDEDDDDPTGTLRHRVGSDYLDKSPESSPIRRQSRRRGSAFPFDESNNKDFSSSAPRMPSIACFFRCFGVSSASSKANSKDASVAPLDVPGYIAGASAWSQRYKCEYYQDDSFNKPVIK